MRRLKGIAVAVAAVLAALVVAAYVALTQLDATAYRASIERRVAEATGRRTTIAGPMDFAFGATPALRMERVRLAGADWAAAGDMATVARLEIELGLWALLTGEVRIRRLVLIRPEVHLRRHADGRANWNLADAPTGGRPGLPRIDRVLVEDATVSYTAGDESRRLTLALDRVRIGPAGAAERLSVDAAGRYQRVPFELSGEAGPPAALAAGRGAYPLDIAVAAAGARVEVAGRLPLDREAREAAVDIAAEVPDLAALAPLAGTDLPALGPLEVRGRLSRRDGAYRVRGIDAALGDSDISGEMTIRPGGARPEVTADLKAAVIDAADIRTMGGTDGAGATAAGGDAAAGARRPVFPATPLPFDLLRAVDVEGDIRIGDLRLHEGLRLSRVDARLTLRDGHLRVAPLSAQMAGGTITATAGVEAGGADSRARLDLAAGDVDYGRLLADLGVTDEVDGTLDGEVRLQGTGDSPRALAAALDGRIDLAGRGGRVTNALLNAASADAARVLAPWRGSDAGMRINCVVARFDVSEGIMTSRALLADTETATVAGDGRISLAEETFDLRFVPQAKRPGLASLAIAMRMTGRLDDPRLAPEPLGAAKAGAVALATLVNPLTAVAAVLIDSAAGEDNPCAAALAAAQRRQGGRGGAGESGGAAGGVGGFLEDLGRSIDEELGVEGDGGENDPAVLQDGDGDQGR